MASNIKPAVVYGGINLSSYRTSPLISHWWWEPKKKKKKVRVRVDDR